MSDSDSDTDIAAAQDLPLIQLTDNEGGKQDDADEPLPPVPTESQDFLTDSSVDSRHKLPRGSSASREGSLPAVVTSDHEASTPKQKKSQQRLSPADFMFGKTLGEGSFARVVHARLKRNGEEYAIKIMEKRHIIKQEKVRHGVSVP